MQYGLRLGQFFLASGVCAMVAGCGVPAVQHPQVLRGPADIGADQSLAGSAKAFPADRWWVAYHDPALDALIDEALSGSPDMALASARVRAADAVVRQSGAANLPRLAVQGTAGGAKQSYNMGYPPSFVALMPHGVQGTGDLSAALGLDLDLWGRNRAALAAARGEAEAARVDAAQARLTLASSVAMSWGQLAALEASRGYAQNSADALAGVERLTADRQREGLDNNADLALATARRAAAQQAVAALDEAVALERNRLAALIGTGPDRARSLPHPAPDLAVVNGVPENLAINLVGRRPDLVSARLRAEAAASRVKAARLAYFPDINLNALVGLQAIGLSNLFASDSSYARFGPAISLPLFQGGQLRGRYDAASAGYDEAVARYNQTLLNAVREVADTLDSRRALNSRLAAARDGATAANDAARLLRLRYREGLANLLQVLTAEDAAFAAQRNLAELETRAFILDVTLVRALGGGFAAPVSGMEHTSQ